MKRTRLQVSGGFSPPLHSPDRERGRV
jgi:hypothetical protein